MTTPTPPGQAEHNRRTRDAYDRLAPVWAATTDDGPWNGSLERPALRSLVPADLAGRVVLDAGCGSGAQAEWLLDQGAEVTGVDLSPRMIEEARRRSRGRGRFLVADLAEPLPLGPRSLDGITSSLALHYLQDWSVPLRSFASALRPGGRCRRWPMPSPTRDLSSTGLPRLGRHRKRSSAIPPNCPLSPIFRPLSSTGSGWPANS